jgi:uncharacterized membrane protein
MKSAHSILWSFAGVIFMIVSLPFILEKVPPNRWSGFRVHKTLSDEKIWYAANQIMGYDLLIAGIIILGTAIATAIMIRSNPALANKINLAVFILSLGVAAAHSFWALDRM